MVAGPGLNNVSNCVMIVSAVFMPSFVNVMRSRDFPENLPSIIMSLYFCRQ